MKHLFRRISIAHGAEFSTRVKSRAPDNMRK